MGMRTNEGERVGAHDISTEVEVVDMKSESARVENKYTTDNLDAISLGFEGGSVAQEGREDLVKW